jgi:hypothetical protein
MKHLRVIDSMVLRKAERTDKARTKREQQAMLVGMPLALRAKNLKGSLHLDGVVRMARSNGGEEEKRKCRFTQKRTGQPDHATTLFTVGKGRCKLPYESIMR